MLNKTKIFSCAAAFFIVFTSSAPSFANINSQILTPTQATAGDVLTSDDWNKLVVGTGSLDKRTRNIKTFDNGSVAIGGNDQNQPNEILEVRGAITLGTSLSDTDGSIRWTGSDFEGFMNSEWTSLTTDSRLGSLSCNANEGIIWDGSSWICSVITDTLSGLNCTDNQSITWSGTSWNCTDSLSSYSCGIDQILKWNGSRWACSSQENGGVWKEKNGNHYILNGNIGVGIDNPTYKFEVANGNTYLGGQLSIGSGKTEFFKVLPVANTGSGISGTILEAAQNKEIRIQSSERIGLEVDTLGNTNIDKLVFNHGAWNDGKNINFKGSGEFSFDFENSDGSGMFHIWAPNNLGSIFTVQSDGKVGIGNSDPSYLLTVGKENGNPFNVSHSGDIIINGGNDDRWSLYQDQSGTLEEKITVNSNGDILLDSDNIKNTGVGTNNPTQKLDVNGKIRMRDQTVSSDSADTVVTKGYVDNAVAGSSGSSVVQLGACGVCNASTEGSLCYNKNYQDGLGEGWGGVSVCYFYQTYQWGQIGQARYEVY